MTLNTFVFQPKELLDGIEGPRLRRQVAQCLTQNPDAILIDFANVQFMDSIGLGSLVGALKEVHDAGKQLYLCAPCEQVKKMFQLTSMERVFTIFPDRRSFERSVISQRISKYQRAVVQQAA